MEDFEIFLHLLYLDFYTCSIDYLGGFCRKVMGWDKLYGGDIKIHCLMCFEFSNHTQYLKSLTGQYSHNLVSLFLINYEKLTILPMRTSKE